MEENLILFQMRSIDFLVATNEFPPPNNTINFRSAYNLRSSSCSYALYLCFCSYSFSSLILLYGEGRTVCCFTANISCILLRVPRGITAITRLSCQFLSSSLSYPYFCATPIATSRHPHRAFNLTQCPSSALGFPSYPGEMLPRYPQALRY